jgi:hypothetical protein
VERQRGQDLFVLVQHRVHPRRVEGVGDPQPAGFAAPPRHHLDDPVDLVGVAGDDQGVGGVHGGDRHPAGEQGGEVGFGGLDGGHRPARGQCLHQPGAGGDQPAGVAQRQHPRHMRGADFADGVAEQVVGGDAPVPQQREQGGLHREQRRLRPPRPV